MTQGLSSISSYTLTLCREGEDPSSLRHEAFLSESKSRDHLKQSVRCLPVASRIFYRQRLFNCIIGEFGSCVPSGTIQVDFMRRRVKSVWARREYFQFFRGALLRRFREKGDEKELEMLATSPDRF